MGLEDGKILTILKEGAGCSFVALKRERPWMARSEDEGGGARFYVSKQPKSKREPEKNKKKKSLDPI